MDTLDQALTEQVVRSYAGALYDDLLDVASLHRRLPELYEDAAAWPPDEASVALAVLVELTGRLHEHADATRELMFALERTMVGLRGGYDRPGHWEADRLAERGWHDDARDV
jgi:hypothetical protein